MQVEKDKFEIRAVSRENIGAKIATQSKDTQDSEMPKRQNSKSLRVPDGNSKDPPTDPSQVNLSFRAAPK